MFLDRVSTREEEGGRQGRRKVEVRREEGWRGEGLHKWKVVGGRMEVVRGDKRRIQNCFKRKCKHSIVVATVTDSAAVLSTY